jgi:hypothetical protein
MTEQILDEKSRKSRKVVTDMARDHPYVKERQRVEKLEREHAKMKVALVQLCDCDWSTINLSDRMSGDTVRKIAREALKTTP